MKGKKVEFHPPQTVMDQIGDVPVGTRMDLLTSYAVKEDGRWCITAIEGVPMPGYDANGNPEGQEHLDMGGGERMAAKMTNAMGSMGGSAGGGY